MKITANQIVFDLLNACPSAESKWKDHVEQWGDDERGIYNDMSVFAHHIVESFQNKQTDEFSTFFDCTERLLRDGDDEVKELTKIGLIEDIQNIASHEPKGWSVFEKWLGPLTKQAWMEVEEMWKSKTSLMDVIRSENEEN